MHDLLNHYPVYFPRRNDQLFTLKRFLDTSNTRYQLPIIVNITSLNNYGRAIKNLLTKNTQLLLIGIYQLDSILAEYHPSNDAHHHTHRLRLTHVQGKMATRATTRFRTMKKLSKSLASLTAMNQVNHFNNDDDQDDEDDDEEEEDDNVYHQRNLVKNLNERRSTAVPLCRIPIQYRRLFELLNENDQAVEPFHNLSDLILSENSGKRLEKWPHAFFLRSICTVYTQKITPEDSHSTSVNDQHSNSTVSNDSCYSSSSDLDSQKRLIILNDEAQILRAGQILKILGECLALHTRVSQRESKEQQQQQQLPPSSPSPSTSSASNWFRDKSRMFFSKRRRRSQTNDILLPSEIIQNKSIAKICEPYLKCQTQHGDIVFIALHETGLFSPLNAQTSISKSNTDFSRLDISGVYQLKTLLSNFRFPFSVRHLDGQISFENNYVPASIDRHEIATKLRLLMQYNENVVFACPINLSPSRSSKTSSPYLLLPLSVNADIEIQPCSNMGEISKTEDFHKLLGSCIQSIEQYQNEISLMNFPLQLTNAIDQAKQTLLSKRSQSASFIGCFDDEDSRHELRRSSEHLNYSNDGSIDHSVSSVSSPLRYRDSIETVKQKITIGSEQSAMHRSVYQTQNKNDRQKRYSCNDYTLEDEMYQDVDKIYDYIRSGDITDEVQKIQAKEKKYHSSHAVNIPNPPNKGLVQETTALSSTPDKAVTHRISPVGVRYATPTQELEFQSCKDDRNVDDDQAHALYMASKQRTQLDSPDVLVSKSVTKMKKLNKH